MKVLVFVLALVACTAQLDSPQAPDAALGDAKGQTGSAQPDGNSCPVQACTIEPQSGCCSDACDVDVGGSAAACRQISSPGHETADCTNLGQCDKGYTCLGDSADATCHKYCTADADCGTPRGMCIWSIADANGQTVPGLPDLCSSNCDPTTTTQPPECPANHKCSIMYAIRGGINVAVAECTLAGTGTQGANCTVGASYDDTMCAPGFVCTNIVGSATYTCKRWCTHPGSLSTPECGGTECRAFSQPFALAGVSYGMCYP